MRIVLSSEAEHKYRESEDQEISEIPFACPSSVCSNFPSIAFHILIVLSAAANVISNGYLITVFLQALASHFPSGENFTEDIDSL